MDFLNNPTAGTTEPRTATATAITTSVANNPPGNSIRKGISLNMLNCNVRDIAITKPAQPNVYHYG